MENLSQQILASTNTNAVGVENQNQGLARSIRQGDASNNQNANDTTRKQFRKSEAIQMQALTPFDPSNLQHMLVDPNVATDYSQLKVFLKIMFAQRTIGREEEI